MDAESAARPRWLLAALATTGWRRRFMLLGLGALAAGALPPVHAMPLLWPAFAGLLLFLAQSRGGLGAFSLGWWFGFGYFVAGLYWLAWPLTLDIVRFGWLIPFAVFGISGGLAIFCGLATAATYATQMKGLARLLAFAAFWTAAEWLRGTMLTGFPWNLPATVWTAYEPMLQPAAHIGAYGLTLITVALAAVPALMPETRLAAQRRKIGIALAALVAVWAGYGYWRLGNAPDRPVADIRLRLVQGNVAQSLKWDPNLREETLTRYLRLTTGAGFERITHVIWPETAIDYRFESDYPAMRIAGDAKRRLGTGVPPNGALILGAIRDRDRRWFNSVHIVSEAGNKVLTYDKHHLVPFGEYVPLRWLLRRIGIEQIAHGGGDYSAGTGPASLPVVNAPAISPMICYEAIFPGQVVGRDRPGWLVNATNDAWFGLTSGPYQHFAAAQLRAVEEGLPLARAANTGITAMVDAYGRVTARLPIMQQGVLDVFLPPAIAEPTLYARLGDRTLFLLMLIFGSIALALDLRYRRFAIRSKIGGRPSAA